MKSLYISRVEKNGECVDVCVRGIMIYGWQKILVLGKILGVSADAHNGFRKVYPVWH